MAYSVDEINTSFRRLKGPAIEGFKKQLPLWDALIRKNKIADEGGTYWERTHIGSSPVKGIGLYTGDEIMPMVTSQVTKQMRVKPHRIAAAINIPGSVIDGQTGPGAPIKLIEAYPKAVLDGTAEDLNKFLLTGISAGMVFPTAELAGYLSLNGQFATGVGVGVTNGLLDFATPATQTDTVQDLAKSTAYHYYNQYEDCTTATLNAQLNNLYGRCAAFSGKPNAGPDLMVQDPETYVQLVSQRQDLVRIKSDNDSLGKHSYTSTPYGGNMIMRDESLDRALFAGAAADGVTYLLNTDFFELMWIRQLEMSDFQDKLASQDMITAKMLMHYSLGCTKLTAQGVLSGGAV